MASNGDEVTSIRRVVTGQTADGRNVFTQVEDVEPLKIGHTSWYGVWGWDAVPALPFHQADPYVPRSVFPGQNPGAMRLNVVVFPAGHGVVKREGGERSEEYARLVAAMPAGGEHDRETGIHTTDSVDIAFVLDGEIGLEQDGGEEVVLRRGDVLVQNGARHAWRNRSDKPCTMAFVVNGALRD